MVLVGDGELSIEVVRAAVWMLGSKSILTVSESPDCRVNLSTGQLKGWSILSMIAVKRGPVFLIVKSFEMGMAGTPFSHTYLKSSLGGMMPPRSPLI